MGYDYQKERPHIFTEEGQVEFLRVRDYVQETLKKSGVITLEKATTPLTGSNWTQAAYVDRLVELGELVEVEQAHAPTGQDRIFREPFR